jgi:hypothetical protein
MKRLLITGSLAIVLLSGTLAYAHHSAAGVDRTKTVTIEGTVKRFNWANPHSYMEVEVPKAGGGTDIWNLEMTSPAFLVRAGWKSTTVKAGDKIKFTANPMKSGDPGGLFLSVTLPDGRTLTERALAGAGTPAAAPVAPATPPSTSR